MPTFNSHAAPGALAVLIAAWGCCNAFAAEPRDPLAEIAAQEPPAFRKLLADEQYAARSAPALAELGDLAALRASGLPAIGAKAVRIEPGGLADQLGLAVGDILVQMDDKPVRWLEFGRDLRQPGTMTIYDVDRSALRTVRFQPGPTGVFFASYWRPELSYLARGAPSAELDRHAVLAIAERSRDPDLAETAWHHAVAGGYRPDFLSAQCGAEIALNQGRAEAAWHFAQAARRLARADDPVSPILLYQAALANFQLRSALDLTRQFPVTLRGKTETLTMLIEEFSAREDARRTLPPPSELARDMYRDDLRPRLAVSDPLRVEGLFLDVRGGEKARFRPQTDAYQQFVMSTPDAVSDFDFTVRLSLKVSDDQPGKFLKYVLLGAYAIDAEEGGTLEPMSIESRYGLLEFQIDGVDGSLNWEHSGLPTRFACPGGPLKVDGRHEHEFRFLGVAGRGEMFIDGRRLAYVPLPEPPRPMAFVVKAVGMSVDLHAVEVVELIEKAGR